MPGHVELLINQCSQGVFFRVGLNPFYTQAVRVLGIAHNHVQDLALSLVELHSMNHLCHTIGHNAHISAQISLSAFKHALDANSLTLRHSVGPVGYSPLYEEGSCQASISFYAF